MVEAIDKLKPPARLIEKPFRMAASDVFKPNTGSGLVVAGRIESGFVMANDKVLVQPLNEIATVKTIENYTLFRSKKVCPPTFGQHFMISIQNFFTGDENY